MTVAIHANRYIGTINSCACQLLYPSSFTIVGAKKLNA